MKQTFALRGNLVYTKKIGTMEILEQQYLVCADGRVQGIYPELPQQFCGIPLEDMGDRIIFATLSSDEFKKTAAAKKNLCGCRSNWRLEAKKSPVVPGK